MPLALPTAIPEFLVIGHLARDVVEGVVRPGGAALYAALTATRLGRRTAVLTSAGPEFDWPALLPAVDLVCRPVEASTTFVNSYHQGRRQQILRARALPLDSHHLPPRWLQARLVLLAPLVGEVSPDLATCFPGALVAATPQGWLRRWDEVGRVWPEAWGNADGVLPHLQAVIVSEEDVGYERAPVEEWAAQVPVLALTQGRGGARVSWRGEWRHFPAFPATEIDPTGAGDVFAAAFLVELARTGDPFVAAPFANAAASLSIEKPGVEAVPTREAVVKRIRGVTSPAKR